MRGPGFLGLARDPRPLDWLGARVSKWGAAVFQGGALRFVTARAPRPAPQPAPRFLSPRTSRTQAARAGAASSRGLSSARAPGPPLGRDPA